jgi:dienelactone hydrolase
VTFHVKHRLWAVCITAPLAVWAAGEPVALPGPAGIELAARLYRPAGPGPFPAIVMLHGCSGLWRQDDKTPAPRYDFWAEHFRERGYVALLVDSFGPRGAREICTHKERTILESRDRPQDAHAALRWLGARPDVDAARIHAMGWSNGGTAVLHTLRPDAPGREAGVPGFRSAVAFYPGCAALSKARYRPTAPLLIQAGGADDWTPARYCRTLAGRAEADGADVQIDVYEGAHHGFDAVGGNVRLRPDVRNPSSPSGWGARVGSHPEARRKAIDRATAFIEAHSLFHVEQGGAEAPRFP